MVSLSKRPRYKNFCTCGQIFCLSGQADFQADWDIENYPSSLNDLMARRYSRSYAQPQSSDKQQKKSGPISSYSRPFPQPQPLQTKAVDLPTEAMQAQAAKYNALARPIQAPEPASTAADIPLMPKLTIGAVNDPYEQEADRVAAQVVQQLNSPPDMMQRLALEEFKSPAVTSQDVQQLNSPPDMMQRLALTKPEPPAFEMQPLVQRKGASAGGIAPPGLEESIQRARAKGQRLAQSIRQPMERTMGADFSGVRIHTDSTANQLSESIQAKAFTTGQDVFFRQGAYAPQSQAGQSLLAHELTHVVQQNGPAVQRQPDPAMIQRVTVAEQKEAAEKKLKADVKHYIALFNRSATLQKKDFESLKPADVLSVLAIETEIKTKITDQPLFDAIGRYAATEFALENPNALLMLNATRDDHPEQLMAVAERLTINLSSSNFSGFLPKGVTYYSGEVPVDVNLSGGLQSKICDAHRRLMSAMYEVGDRGVIIGKRSPSEVDVPTAVTAQLDLANALSYAPKEIATVIRDTMSRMGDDPAVKQALSTIRSLRAVPGGATKGKILGGYTEVGEPETRGRR